MGDHKVSSSAWKVEVFIMRPPVEVHGSEIYTNFYIFDRNATLGSVHGNRTRSTRKKANWPFGFL